MKYSDICLSIRNVRKSDPETPGSLDAGLALIGELKPTRLEWSYTWRHMEIAQQLKAETGVFVAAINTITPHGHATSFEGDPVIAPWMKAFGKPGARPTYMCQNNPEDVQARLDQVLEIVEADLTDTFQHDDWYCNAQMLSFGNPCFCGYCMARFTEYLGFDAAFDYGQYLRARGITHTAELLELAKLGRVPLWDDYRRFQEQTVTRYFRTLRTAMDRCLGRPATLSVNGSALGFGGQIGTILPFVSYLHSETPHFAPERLKELSEKCRELGIRHVVSFFPDVQADAYDSPDFVGRINQAIGVCYCLGLLPLFPYDVYAGDKPRWFGTWEQYRASYTVVRQHPEWFDDYSWSRFRRKGDTVLITSRHNTDSTRVLEHALEADGSWRTEPATTPAKRRAKATEKSAP